MTQKHVQFLIRAIYKNIDPLKTRSARITSLMYIKKATKYLGQIPDDQRDSVLEQIIRERPHLEGFFRYTEQVKDYLR